MITENKQDLDEWINQHLEERERRLSGNNPFVWHQPNANDLLPSNQLRLDAIGNPKDQVQSLDLDKPINFK